MYAETDRARLVAEPAKDHPVGRSPFQRDRARVLHSAALRRLAGKTQVVGVGEDDFPRTRLTHSLECAQIGRELGAALGADPDIVDAACLAHDLGHPPFGHNGEQALDALAGDCGGFEGNAQSLRILTRLEAKVLTPAGDGAGLNLTRAVLDAATKYPWPRRDGAAKYGVYAEDRQVFDWVREGAPDDRRCVEAQLMDWADDVAYSVHDLEDGVHTGHLPLDAPDRDAVCATAGELYSDEPPEVLRAALDRLTAQPWWPGPYDGTLRAQAAIKALTSALIGRLCTAVVRATRAAYGEVPLVRYAGDLVVPAEARAECAVLKALTAHHVMRRDGAAAAQTRQRELLAELVAALADRAPDALDPALRPAYHAASDDPGRLRIVIDQVASLTDRSAVHWHARLTRRP